MQIRKIKTLKGYKSFADFDWQKFCKNKDGQESILQKFTIIFGENGSGKSSVCDVLKSVSQTQDFINSSPTLAEIEINNDAGSQEYKYENGKWTPGQLDKKSVLFFDIDFINANVHTHGLRSSNLQQGAHTQKAGKLIIDLDEQANNLKMAKEEKRKELEIFLKSNDRILGTIFNDKDKELFGIYEKVTEEDKKNKIDGLKENLNKLENELAGLQKLNTKYSEINRIVNISEISALAPLSLKEIYSEIFSRQIKEKAQDSADEKIKAHFEKHKYFIEKVKDQIPENYPNEACPLCMQPLVNATKVIEYYRVAFDQTYETAKRAFLLDIEAIKNELNILKSSLNLLPTKVVEVFDRLEKIKIDFEIHDIYLLEEKTEHSKNFSNLLVSEIDELLGALESLKSIEHKENNVDNLYEVMSGKVVEIEKSLKDLNALIILKNQAIVDFKSKYSDQNKISTEVQEITQKKLGYQEVSIFLQSDKIKAIKDYNESIIKQKLLSDEQKKAQDELKDYLEKTIPESVINQMIATLNMFNLSFTLEHIKPSANTKDYSFAFRIKDNKGNEREFKDGLSEGERQLISLAFFFSINESLPNKQNTILIFDDPITSLDSPNLKILAELIHKKVQEFSQVIVFTHHPLFLKYLAKCENPNPCKFGVLKNGEIFGGSFVFSDPGFDLITEIQECSNEINNNAQNGNLKPEEIALRYGQLLRLAVEKFIKNDLLMWDKDGDFAREIVVNLGKSKSKIQKLEEVDLEVITNMYKYCNYSNLLHADKETPSALSELRTHIDKFVGILDKVKIEDI